MKNNVIGGHKAKSAGDSFEELFIQICNRERIVCVDFPNGCRRVNTPYGLKLFATTMPFDFMICRAGLAAAIDVKTTQGKSFTYSSIVPHQLKSLTEVGPHLPAGYVVWFREVDRIVFFDYLALQSLQPRQSLQPENGIFLGSIRDAKIERILTHETATAYQRTLI